MSRILTSGWIYLGLNLTWLHHQPYLDTAVSCPQTILHAPRHHTSVSLGMYDLFVYIHFSQSVPFLLSILLAASLNHPNRMLSAWSRNQNLCFTLRIRVRAAFWWLRCPRWLWAWIWITYFSAGIVRCASSSCNSPPSSSSTSITSNTTTSPGCSFFYAPAVKHWHPLASHSWNEILWANMLKNHVQCDGVHRDMNKITKNITTVVYEMLGWYEHNFRSSWTHLVIWNGHVPIKVWKNKSSTKGNRIGCRSQNGQTKGETNLDKG